MAPGSRPEGRLNLSYLPPPQTSLTPSGTSTSNTSPIEPPTSASVKSAYASPNAIGSTGPILGSARLGAGSPLHDQTTRLFPKRTRELQAQEGLSPGIWGPPTSGNSTPLRETIPESPTQDGFPDLVPPAEGDLSSPARRARAGTVPSRFPPVGTSNGSNSQQSTWSKTSRPTPTTSPFNPHTPSSTDASKQGPPISSTNAALLSRLRAGSMPQRSSFLGSSNPFGPTLFSSNWSSGTDRSTTLTSIRSTEDPSSPSQSSFSRDGLVDTDVRTLDYLGLVETPQQSRATLARNMVNPILLQHQQPNVLPQLLANFELRNANRFRSYSVNATEKYAEGEEEELGLPYSGLQSGTLTPSAAATAAQFSALQNEIEQHNQAVQAFAQNASAARPRARTAGILDTPSQRMPSRTHLGPSSRLDSGVSSVDRTINESIEQDNLANSVRLMHLNGNLGNMGRELPDENDNQSSRSLWIGSIPVSTTSTSLDAIFGRYGAIESTRVLTHKNCGFVNYESIEDAIQARQMLNGKEIFPGAGPVRIGFAKAPNASTSDTPSYNAVEQSPTPDPYTDDFVSGSTAKPSGKNADSPVGKSLQSMSQTAPPRIPDLTELHSDLLQIIIDFGASADDLHIISSSVDNAIAYQQFESEIPPISEPTNARMYDAPRLRDIRKRIDNGSCGLQEIEETASDMLPEIAELASDYLGNTVVQKLFEFCSEPIKEQMLIRIAPHLADIGVHKNGTWAAQKIIDVCRTAPQMTLIINNLRPYTVSLFLDQYGNYVLQCCLRFGSPFNDFIFETMLSRLWEIAQGRYGARAIRACLESHHSTKQQQRMLTSAIALYSVHLATNTNGALLLTWFLDTCTFPQRRTVLAPQLVPHLVHLCTHKVAYLTVLKVINQRNEPEAREIILQSLFFSEGDAVLEQILIDQSSGATLIFKILTTPFFDESLRNEVVRNVSKVLVRIKAQPNQGYKRLMDEVGLSSRPAHPPVQGSHNHAHSHIADRTRQISQPDKGSYMSPPTLERQYSGQYGSNLQGHLYENSQGPIRSGSADSANFTQYTLNGHTPFPQSPLPTLTPGQIQYQALLAASQRNNNTFLPSVATNGFGGYATPPPSIDTFRTMQSHGSPLTGPAQMGAILSGNAFGQQTYHPAMNNSMYGYPQQGLFTNQVQPVHGGGRRGRR